MHCRHCRCALVQDELRLLLMGGPILGGAEVDCGHGNASQTHQTADECWFGRTSVSEANDAPVKSFPGHVNLRSPPSMVSFPSPGNLVCSSPAVPASMPRAGAELLQLHGREPFLAGPLFVQEDYSRTNQALGRECHPVDVFFSMGLSLNKDLENETTFNLSADTVPLIPTGDLWPCNSSQSWNLLGQINEGPSSLMSWDDSLSNFSQESLNCLREPQPTSRRMIPENSLSIPQKFGDSGMDFYEDNIGMNPFTGMGVGPEASFYKDRLDVAVFGAVSDSRSNLNSHMYTPGEDPEGVRRPKFSMDISQLSSNPGFPLQDPSASGAIEVGTHRHDIVTENNGPQVDNTQSEVDMEKIVPAEAVPTSFPSSKYNIVPHCKSWRRFSCPKQGCKITATSQKDIDRHVRSMHSEGPEDVRRIMCPVSGCPKAQTGFTRRDHYIRHMERIHNIMVNGEKRGRKRIVRS